MHLAASRSYISYSRYGLEQKLSKNPYSFLHVLNPDFRNKDIRNPITPQGLKRIKEKFLDFHSQNIYKKDERPCFYIYQQIRAGIAHTGLIACISIDDYGNGVIKKHEATLSKKEEKLKNYLRIVDINAEPVCMTYPRSEEVAMVVRKVVEVRPEYDFSTVDGVRHLFWIIEDKEDIEQIQEYFGRIPKVYIADGHHRSASSWLLGKEKRKKKVKYTGKEGFNYFMGIFFSEDNIRILQFSRMVKDLNGLSDNEFLQKLNENFIVEKKGKDIYYPKEFHDISMYLSDNWYSLRPKDNTYDPEHPSEHLDTSILTENILKPILGISDPRHDERISYLGGREDLKPLRRIVDSGKMKVAFVLYPVTIEQLKNIADSGEVMPPKSTWIEPKLMTGLTIYSLEDESNTL